MMAQRTPQHATKLPYRTGEKGTNRVRLYAHPKSGMLQIEFYDEAGGRRTRSLGHTDVAQGKLAADELAAKLRAGAPPPSDELTLGGLFDRYDREVTPTKAESTQEHDRLSRWLLERCWGAHAKVRTIDRRDWDRFIQQRRSGALHPPPRAKSAAPQQEAPAAKKVPAKPRPVRDRTIAYDLQYVLAACNWALTVRERGQPLLERNPLKGFPLPSEASPRRPITASAEYEKLREAARTLGGCVPLFLTLVHETGHRCMAVARLRWSDVDLEGGRITWRAEYDKKGREHVLPVSTTTLTALKAARRQQPRIGDGWLFPNPLAPDAHVPKHMVRTWWEQLEAAAGLERMPGRGWHSLRRKFATDHRARPLAEVMALGGWKDPNTLVKCYQHPPEDGLREALEARAATR